MQHNPYPGPRPFKRGEPLYGRARETLEVLDLLIAERIVLLYSPSGAGKTSLVQAALIPQLRQEGYQVLPVIRLKFDPGPAANGTPQNRYIRSALLALEEGLPQEQRTTRAALAELTLDAYLAHFPAEGTASQVLIFDQFEEILTVEPTELAAKEQFFREVGEALRNRNRWGLFVMREDYIAGLNPYVRHLPTRLNTTYRLDLLEAEAAKAAIREPAHDAGVDFTVMAAEKLVNDLRWVQVQRADGAIEPRLGPYVEPVQLQVVCWRLWDKLPDGTTQIEESDLTEVLAVDEALTGYYAECVAAIAEATGESERVIRNWFGQYLITEQGVRGQVLMEQGSSQGLQNSTIRLLENAHLVRADERRGAIWFELAHDRLVAPIRADNAVWTQQHLSMLQLQAELWDRHERQPGLLLPGASLLQAEEWAGGHTAELTQTEQDFLAACREARTAAEREERNHRRLQRLTLLVAVLAVAALLFGVYAARQNQLAEGQRKVATARQLAAQSLAVAEHEVDTSLLLAVEAYRRQPLDEVRSSLAAAVQCCSDSLYAFMRSHTDRVWDVAFSADGRLLASSGDDGTIVVWDVAARTPITTVVNPQTTAAVYTVAFSPRGDILAAGDGDGEIILRNTNNWQPIGKPLQGHDFNVHSVVFSKDGSLLVSGGGDGKVVVWSVANRQQLVKFPGHKDWVWDVAISPNNRTVASVGRDATVRLWGLEASDTLGASVEMTRPHTGVITSVAFNDDPVLPLMITGDVKGNVVLWDMRHWEQRHVAPMVIKSVPVSPEGYFIWGLAFVPGRNLSFVSSAGNGTLTRQHILLTTDMRKAGLRPEKLGVVGHSGTLRVAISPDGKTIAAAGADKLVSLWSADEASNVLWHSAALSSMRVITPADQLVALDRNGRLFHWDYGQRNLLSRLSLSPSTPFSNSVISYDGALIATGDDSGTITVWNGAGGEWRRKLESTLGPIASLAFSRDGRKLAAGDAYGKVTLWDGEAPFELVTESVPEGTMKVLLFSPDGRILAGGGCGHAITFPRADCGRGEVYLWDVTTHRLLGEPLPGKSGFVLSLAFNPTNPDELAVGTADGNITIWDLRGRRQKNSFGAGGTPDIRDLAFSPDGRLLAAATDRNLVHLFDTRTGGAFGRFFREHNAPVSQVTFSRDGELLLSAANDRTIVLHDLRSQHWGQRACEIANRSLSPEEWQRFVDPDPATYRNTTCAEDLAQAEQGPRR